MKKNIGVIIIIIVFTIAVIGLIVVLRPKNNYSDSEIVEINYSYSGGYGTMAYTSNKIVTITPDGVVKLSNDYNSYTESFNISTDKYTELSDYIVERMSLFDEKAEIDSDVLDGGSYYLSIKLETGETKKIGGYMIKNKKFDEIVSKLHTIIDRNRISEYEDRIEDK